MVTTALDINPFTTAKCLAARGLFSVCLIFALLSLTGTARNSEAIENSGATGNLISTPNLPALFTNSLQGKLLVAQTALSDPRFSRTVIFIVRHDASGAFGLIVNRPLGTTPAASVFKYPRNPPLHGDIDIYYGGPVDPHLAFILHTTDYKGVPTMRINDQYAISQTQAVIAAMQSKTPPSGALFILGYAGWSEGQLEQELTNKQWAVAPSIADIVFKTKNDEKWRRAFDNRFLDI